MLNFQPGDQIFENFEVLKCLGAGTLTLGYLCRDSREPNRTLVVKTLYEECAKDLRTIERVQSFITPFQKLRHPNVVRVYDFLESDSLFGYTLEYADSGDLTQKIENRPPLEEIVEILIQACRGVGATHEYGLIHRNLKPEKIFLTSEGTVKIGESSVGYRTGGSRKEGEDGSVSASISYVPPEYLQTGETDYRADIYGLGILAYELVTGAWPYSEKSVYHTMTAILNSTVDPPSEINTECPIELSEIIVKAMHRKPDARFQNVSELEQALETLVVQAT